MTGEPVTSDGTTTRRCATCGAVLEATGFMGWLLEIVSDVNCEACVREMP